MTFKGHLNGTLNVKLKRKVKGDVQDQLTVKAIERDFEGHLKESLKLSSNGNLAGHMKESVEGIVTWYVKGNLKGTFEGSVADNTSRHVSSQDRKNGTLNSTLVIKLNRNHSAY